MALKKVRFQPGFDKQGTPAASPGKWIDGDFIESQAFAYLSIRSLYKKPISFPNSTGVNKPVTGGQLISKPETGPTL